MSANSEASVSAADQVKADAPRDEGIVKHYRAVDRRAHADVGRPALFADHVLDPVLEFGPLEYSRYAAAAGSIAVVPDDVRCQPIADIIEGQHCAADRGDERIRRRPRIHTPGVKIPQVELVIGRADITGCTLQVAGSSQACALGSAVVATVLAGAQPDFPTAQVKMTSLKEVSYSPIPKNQTIYNQLYQLYRQLHDAFGGTNKKSDLSQVMPTLIQLRNSAN